MNQMMELIKNREICGTFKTHFKIFQTIFFNFSPLFFADFKCVIATSNDRLGQDLH